MSERYILLYTGQRSNDPRNGTSIYSHGKSENVLICIPFYKERSSQFRSIDTVLQDAPVIGERAFESKSNGFHNEYDGHI